MHVSYDAMALLDVFLIGLWLGWIRLRSGSTFVTMILHASQNGAVLAIAMLFYPPA
jgi:membrane protease YdiL (CAAX protease family)